MASFFAGLSLCQYCIPYWLYPEKTNRTWKFSQDADFFLRVIHEIFVAFIHEFGRPPGNRK